MIDLAPAPTALAADLAAIHRLLGRMARLLRPHATSDTTEPVSAAHLSILKARAKVGEALDSTEGSR